VSPAANGNGRRIGFRRRARRWLVAGAGAFLAIACALLLLRARVRPYTPGIEAAQSDEITRRLERDLPQDVPRIAFTDAAEEAGLEFRHFSGTRSVQLPEDMGSGATWGDYDDDGDPDLFLVNMQGPLPHGEPAGVPQTGAAPEAGRALQSGAVRSALFRNEGRGRFSDVTDAAGLDVSGWGLGAAWGDYDGDGRLDLFVSRYGTNRLFRNRGDGTFDDVTRATGTGGLEGFWTSASWADYDRDGDLDLYVCGYVRYRYDAALQGRSSLQYQAQVPFTLNPSTYEPERNLLYRNEGGRFREVARQAGVDNPTGRSLSAAWADFDLDGWPDLYVANDVSDNAMFHNRGDGTFTDVSHSAWVADHRGAMGLAIGDWDDDGDFDIFITHWLAQENALYENQRGKVAATAREPMHFVDAADQRGLGQIALDFVGWGTEFFDYDNDGRLDLLVVNGSTFQREEDPSLLVPMRNQLFWNAGRERGFFEVGAVSGPSFPVENVGRGAAVADYDQDGDLDAVVAVNGGPARLLRNDGGDANGFLRLVLRGRRPARGGAHATSTFAPGAIARVTAGSVTRMQVVGSGPSYLGSSPPGELHFGLGDAGTVERLEVTWPSGRVQAFENLPARSVVTVIEGEEPVVAGPSVPTDRAAIVRFWQAIRTATSLRTQRDFAAAERSYRDALLIDPRHEDALYYLGWCLAEQGRPEEARDALQRLIEVNPASARGHLALGALLSSPEAGSVVDPGRAEQHLRRAHDINGEETGPMVRLGELLIVRGGREEAGRFLQGAAYTNPRSVEAAFLAGYVCWEERERPCADAFYRRAIEAAKVQAPVRGVLGEGDRKAAPPLEAPMGRMLFGAFGDALRAAARSDDTVRDRDDPDLDPVYRPVRARAEELRRLLGGASLSSGQ
jgi:tetratricopeptide (TPR) repeat protein